MQERLAEWGQALQQLLASQLDAGSAGALAVVFAAGVLTSFTPCVYPMIPVTVTFLGGAAGGQKLRAVTLSSVYVLGLALVYAALGMVTALVGAQFGTITRSPWIYGGVALVILAFGAAMLDWIPIPAPAIFGQMQTRGARRGGHAGALVMGMAAGLVAAPCTAPVLGLLLVYVATTRQVLWGGTLLLVFALGLGFLLFVLGIFSGMLASLPRAGAWMVRLKQVFGAGMLLLAAWFGYQAVWMALHP